MSKDFGQAEQAIVSGDLRALKQWGERGGNFHELNSIGEGLMHKAAFNGEVEIAAFLLGKGLSLLARDDQGFTPLHEAARNAKESMADWLLEHGANPAAKTSSDKTPFELAQEKTGDEAQKVKRLLLNATAKILWRKTGDDEITCVTPKPLINHTLTEVFNFRAKTYLLITANDSTKAESAVFRTFSDFTDTQLLEKAGQEFTRLGGRLPDGFEKLDKPKRGLTGRSFG